jgi:hypothetical protein
MALYISDTLTPSFSDKKMVFTDAIFDESKNKFQSEINSKLMEGKIYDAEEGKWVSNELTKATTDTLGGIKVAGNREVQDDNPIIKGETDNVLGRLYGVELDQNGTAFVHVPWKFTATPVAGANLGLVREGENTGIVIDDNGVIKADFDTDVYSVENITTHNFSTTTVASPDTVKKIFDAYNQVFLDTLGDVETAQLNLHNAIYGTDYTETSQIPVE